MSWAEFLIFPLPLPLSEQNSYGVGRPKYRGASTLSTLILSTVKKCRCFATLFFGSMSGLLVSIYSSVDV
ncbi:hypothetical protein ACN38_g6911 [Penicillium nordicum]|uniref:Uncharacterized protein n=1 Tax=Penicillium nordicum TaxID=229535 RepID=A0A0M8P2J5_9EURO|nr:hypothetical protein ACN38_g6911 [Penicillium nordicum]